MNSSSIEIIFDRFVAKSQKRQKDRCPAEVQTLLLELKEEALNCLKHSEFSKKPE